MDSDLARVLARASDVWQSTAHYGRHTGSYRNVFDGQVWRKYHRHEGDTCVTVDVGPGGPGVEHRLAGCCVQDLR